MFKKSLSQVSKEVALLGILLLSLIAHSAESSCPELKIATYTCSREFSFFDDKVPWKPQTFKIEKPLLMGGNSISWSFDSEVGTWVLDGVIHHRAQFIDTEFSQAQCLADGKIEAVEVFQSPRLFDVHREMTLVKLENSLRITFIKDILIRGHATNSDEEKWNCSLVPEPEPVATQPPKPTNALKIKPVQKITKSTTQKGN